MTKLTELKYLCYTVFLKLLQNRTKFLRTLKHTNELLFIKQTGNTVQYANSG